MPQLDMAIARLQYEILNMPLEQILQESMGDSGMIKTFEREIDSAGWQQWWSEADLVLEQTDEQLEDGEDALSAQTEIFLERSRKRMAVFQMAKEFMLAQRYAKLEKSLVDTAITLSESLKLEAKDIKSLGGLYKDLTSKSIANTLATMQFGIDEGGLPTVILRDLSNGS